MNLPDLTGQRIIVTGANTGLGYASTVALAGAGAEVVLAVRDQPREWPRCSACTTSS